MPISFFAKILTMLHKKPFVISLSPLLLALFCQCCGGTQFTVGDSSGWGIPPYPIYYSNWSQSQFLRIGDSLEFNFDPKFYNLVQVSQYEYEHCTSFDSGKVFNSSPAIVPLKERGVFFFICNISNYCCLGQKIAITVHDCSSQSPRPFPPPPSPSPLPLVSSPAPPPSEICCTVASTPSSSPPNGSALSPMPSPSGNSSIGGHFPENSMAISLVRATSFSISMKNLFSTFGTFFMFYFLDFL